MLNTCTSFLCLASTRCLSIQKMFTVKNTLKIDNCFRLESSAFKTACPFFFFLNSKILLIHIWVNLQSFVCIPIVQRCLTGTYSKHMTVCFLLYVSLLRPIHLHILMRWLQRTNSGLWSHRMPVSCAHFPLFVSPWPRTHMEAWAVSCRQA